MISYGVWRLEDKNQIPQDLQWRIYETSTYRSLRERQKGNLDLKDGCFVVGGIVSFIIPQLLNPCFDVFTRASQNLLLQASPHYKMIY